MTRELLSKGFQISFQKLLVLDLFKFEIKGLQGKWKVFNKVAVSEIDGPVLR